MTAAVAALACACHGRIVAPRFAPNHAAAFDFARPPCAPSARDPAADRIHVRYLGAGGVHVEWRGQAILGAPFFTNPGPWHVVFGAARPDAEAFDRGIAGTPLERVRAVLVGHAHYDHAGDLPLLLPRLDEARVFVNHSAWNLLACASPAHALGLVDLESDLPPELRIEGDDGRTFAVVRPVVSTHASHLGCWHFARGEVNSCWPTWRGRRWRSMREGLPFAFVIDLLDTGGDLAFRIWYQDAAGLPPELPELDPPVDLAILTMPSHWHAAGYPEAVLGATRPAHVMAIHHEDFLRSIHRPQRFVATLTDARAETFLETVADAPTVRGGLDVRCGCGPCAPRWSLPLRGDWMSFSPGALGSR